MKTSIYSIAALLSTIAYLPSDLGAGTATGGETDMVEGVKITLSAEDVANVNKLVDATGWDKEQVLVFAHGILLSGNTNQETGAPFKDFSEVLKEGADEFSTDPATGLNVAEAIGALRDKHGDDIADSSSDYVGDPEDDAEIAAFLADLFGGDDDDYFDDENA